MSLVKSVARRLLGLGGNEMGRKDLAPSGSAPTPPSCDSPTPPLCDSPTLWCALTRLEQRGSRLFNTVIDVGASDGRWSQVLIERNWSVDYLLIEAQTIHEPGLMEFCSRNRTARYVLAAAGDKEGEIYFHANDSDPFGGRASSTPFARNGIRVPMTTIDSEVKRHALSPPYLVKLDTHGFEVPILRGAAETLKQTSVLIIECYNFQVAPPDSLLFHEMCQHLAGSGFRCMDMYDLLYRQHDLALWQMDVLFMKSDRPEFSHRGYY